MRLPRLWDDEQLLLRDEQRVEAACHNKEFAGVVFINSVDVRRGELNLGAG